MSNSIFFFFKDVSNTWCNIFFNMVQIALGNILKFRKKNWQFDFIGGIIYFVLAFSMFPQVSSSVSFYFFNLFLFYLLSMLIMALSHWILAL